MPREKDDLAYVWDMLNAAKAIQEFVSGLTYESYASSHLVKSAVERQVEIIGEAANRTSKAFRDENDAIPWGKIIAQRHVIAHEYGEIKHDKIWILIERHIPDLVSQLERLMESGGH